MLLPMTLWGISSALRDRRPSVALTGICSLTGMPSRNENGNGGKMNTTQSGWVFLDVSYYLLLWLLDCSFWVNPGNVREVYIFWRTLLIAVAVLFFFDNTSKLYVVPICGAWGRIRGFKVTSVMSLNGHFSGTPELAGFPLIVFFHLF